MVITIISTKIAVKIWTDIDVIQVSFFVDITGLYLLEKIYGEKFTEPVQFSLTENMVKCNK